MLETFLAEQYIPPDNMATDCVRCDKCFVSSEALEQHLRMSPAHNVCSTCVIDFTTRLSIIQHYLSSPSHNYCQRCDSHFDVPAKLARHIESVHHQCLMCGLSLVRHLIRSRQLATAH